MDDAARQAELAGKLGPHLARHRQQLEAVRQFTQWQQRLTGPLAGLGDGTTGQRLGHHAVTALETDRAADAGDRIDDEP
uniref:hypothetical protein n=1 Tax=Aeromonas hydrophila TaxID=644 RepID=UPI001FED6FC6|nr:hypothetical protein [Aeromonas hydrophila]